MSGQDFLNINANIQIAFALTLIVGLLIYIAFYKSPGKRNRKR